MNSTNAKKLSGMLREMVSEQCACGAKKAKSSPFALPARKSCRLIYAHNCKAVRSMFPLRPSCKAANC